MISCLPWVSLLSVRSRHSCCRAASSKPWELMCVLGVVLRGGWGGLRPVTLCEVVICVAHSFLDHVQVNLLYLWLPLSREVIIVYSTATGQMSKRTLNERPLKAFCDGGHWLCFHFSSYKPRQEESQNRLPALPCPAMGFVPHLCPPS